MALTTQAAGRVVVTGGAGFIGSHVVRSLLQSGVADHVTVLDDLSTGTAANLAGVAGVDLVVGSIADAEAVRRVVSGADAIVHLAARASVPASMEDPLGTHDVNVTGTLHVLEAAREAGGLYTLLASSAAVYGRQAVSHQHELLVPAPESPYAVSKVLAEQYAAAYTRAFGLPTLAFRFFNVFGSRQPVDHVYAAAIPAFASAAVAGRPVTVHGDGEQTRDLIHVSTVASVICRALAGRIRDTTPINLACGRAYSINQVVAIIGRLVDTPLEVVHTEARAGDIRNSCAATGRFHERFPGSTGCSLEEGLSETLAWFRRGPRITADDARSLREVPA